MNKISICTIVSLNYFSNALTLCDSIRKYHDNIDFNILVVDKDMEEICKSNESYTVYNVENIGIDNVEKLAFKYNVIEFNTAVKPFFMEYLYINKGYDSVMYIDPDMMLFNKIDELTNLLKDYSMILTPHICEDRYEEGTMSELDFLKCGIYNLGFFATKRDDNTFKMLKWWKERLYDQCYMENNWGLAWDQKWMNFLPALFEGVFILKDVGYNMAHWNMHERYISKVNDEFVVNKKYKLVIFHFSQYRISEPDLICNLPNVMVNNSITAKLADRPDLKELYNIYYDAMVNNKYKEFSKIKYGFNYFDNGVEILKINRRLYGGLEDKFSFFKDPFNTSESNSFYQWSIKQGYASSNNINTTKNNTKANKLSTSNKQIKLVLRIFKIMRRLLGINRYCNLLRKVEWAANISDHYRLYLLTDSNLAEKPIDDKGSI